MADAGLEGGLVYNVYFVNYLSALYAVMVVGPSFTKLLCVGFILLRLSVG